MNRWMNVDDEIVQRNVRIIVLHWRIYNENETQNMLDGFVKYKSLNFGDSLIESLMICYGNLNQF